MKVIDLLNKIANGEEVPKKIKYCSTNFYYDDNGKDYLSIQNQFNDGGISICKYIFSGNLNDTVEIIEDTPKVQVELTEKEYLEYLDKINEYMQSIRDYIPKPSFLKLEEDKKIEKLDLSDWWEITSSEDCKPEMLAKIFNKNAKAFSSKINEIINKINGDEENEN